MVAFESVFIRYDKGLESYFLDLKEILLYRGGGVAHLKYSLKTFTNLRIGLVNRCFQITLNDYMFIKVFKETISTTLYHLNLKLIIK